MRTFKNLLFFSMAFSVFCVLAGRVSSEFDHALVNGAMTRILLNVVDETGDAVHGANVHVLMGMNFRKSAYYIDGVTDKNGAFVIEGKTTGNEIVIEVSKDNHYRSRRKLTYVKAGNECRVDGGRWQPWNRVENLVLYSIRRPAELVFGFDAYLIPMTNTWIGFDMEMKDWVKPYSKGQIADFEVRLDWDGKPPPQSVYSCLEVRFCGEGAGVYYADKSKDSVFSGVYSAMTNETFRQDFCFKAIWKEGKDRSVLFDSTKVMVARTRCVYDSSQHRLLRANYSMIKGVAVMASWEGKGEMTLKYYYNPTCNDTNLEFCETRYQTGSEIGSKHE